WSPGAGGGRGAREGGRPLDASAGAGRLLRGRRERRVRRVVERRDAGDALDAGPRALLTRDPLSAEPGGELAQRFPQSRGIAPGAEHLERASPAVKTRLGSADQMIAFEQRQDVVAELALR